MESSIVEQQLLTGVKFAFQFFGLANAATKIFGVVRTKFGFQSIFEMFQCIVFN